MIISLYKALIHVIITIRINTQNDLLNHPILQLNSPGGAQDLHIQQHKSSGSNKYCKYFINLLGGGVHQVMLCSSESLQ